MTLALLRWDEEADVIVVGYGFAGATAAMTAHNSGAKVLLLEKAPEEHKGATAVSLRTSCSGPTILKRRRPISAKWPVPTWTTYRTKC
jgi:succinate dehydrogenase/fumarate reductase flavoprotein subunit